MRIPPIEDRLDRKLKPKYNGPYVVLNRNKGGAYIVAEMDGSVYQSVVAAFRLLPYHARKKIELPRNIHESIDLGPAELNKLVSSRRKGEPADDIAFEGMPKGNRQSEQVNADNDLDNLGSSTEDG